MGKYHWHFLSTVLHGFGKRYLLHRKVGMCKKGVKYCQLSSKARQEGPTNCLSKSASFFIECFSWHLARKLIILFNESRKCIPLLRFLLFKNYSNRWKTKKRYSKDEKSFVERTERNTSRVFRKEWSGQKKNGANSTTSNLGCGSGEKRPLDQSGGKGKVVNFAASSKKTFRFRLQSVVHQEWTRRGQWVNLFCSNSSTPLFLGRFFVCASFFIPSLWLDRCKNLNFFLHLEFLTHTFP